MMQNNGEENTMNTMNITIHEATEQDRNAVHTLAAQLATSYVVQQQAFDESFTHIVNHEASVVFVAKRDDVIIGYCLGFAHPAFYANGNVAWVEELFVEEALRRQNIGRMLMDTFEAWAHARHCVLAALATRRAAEFYTAIGYEESAVYFKKVLT